jgi:hypothetical protein
MGPGLDYTYPTGGYFLGESRMVPYDLPAGRRATFSWTADASGACVDIHSYRWALDMEDVTDQTPRIDEATDLEHWSAPSRTVTSATVGPFSIPLPPEPGSHLFFVEATDMNGFKSLGMIRINVTPAVNRPPDCALAVAELLGSGPGNRSFARVAIRGVTDPDGDPITITAMGVTQDEALDGIGEAHTCPDASIERGIASVRLERSGTGNGRVYTIAFTTDDGQGGVCEGTVDVCIPHGRGAQRDCVKDPVSVNSLGDCDRPLPPRSRATLEPWRCRRLIAPD